ncbi:MAG: hypothetical protein ACI3VB_01915 [Oscillospiraceae bacterium]
MNKKNLIALVSAIVFAAAAVTAIIVFRDQIRNFFIGVKEKLPCGKKEFTSEEFEDFADI